MVEEGNTLAVSSMMTYSFKPRTSTIVTLLPVCRRSKEYNI